MLKLKIIFFFIIFLFAFQNCGKFTEDSTNNDTFIFEKSFEKKSNTVVLKFHKKSPQYVTLTKGVPSFESGQKITDFNSAFQSKTIKVVNNKVKLTVEANPIFLEVPLKDTTTNSEPSLSTNSKNSPFGAHPAHTYTIQFTRKELSPPSEIGNDFTAAQEIGIQWTRPEYYSLWDEIQKTDEDIENSVFNWEQTDYVYTAVPKNISIMANIAGIDSRVIFLPKTTTFFPKTFQFKTTPIDYEKKYIEFVERLVERYDGDDIDDVAELKSPIKYWQIENEPDLASKDYDGYVHLVEITSQAIKESCSDCKIVLGGMAGEIKGLQEFYQSILEKLNENKIKIDVFDFHFFGNLDHWKGLKDMVSHIRSALDSSGQKDVEIWTTENGTHSGAPTLIKIPSQTESEQAANLIKRFIYSLSLGIKKFFWAFGIIEGFSSNGTSEFDYYGLIYDGQYTSDDPGYGVKKLSYYSYGIMTKKLSDCDFDNIKTLDLGENVYGFKFQKPSATVYVLWSESK